MNLSVEERRRPISVAILSFDRPHYLREVLHSLRRQVSDQDEIVLFQDGPINPQTKQFKTDPERVEQCIRVFRKLIPWGVVSYEEVNSGIAFNYERAERYFFETLQRPYALFLEDDLVLSPHYLTVIHYLLDIARSDKRVAYVSAYGNLWASLDEQLEKARELRHMHENWGFAMTREAWLEERPFRRQYLSLLQGADYTNRDSLRIEQFYAYRGWKTKFTSQDASRWISAVELGKVRITTFACYARYIGETGVHFTRELYYRCGFDQTLMLETPPVRPERPTTPQIRHWLETERKRFRGELGPFYKGHGGQDS